jgi:uncharacterized protein (DUF1697 family)
MKNSNAEKPVSYVAFLRGINIGGNVLIKMDELRNLFESAGYMNVRTVLASGNVLFDTKLQKTTILARDIGFSLRQTYGRDIGVIVFPLNILKTLEQSAPFRDIEVSKNTSFIVTFVPEGLDQGNFDLLSHYKDYTIKSIGERMICGVLRMQPGKGTPDLMYTLEKAFGKSITNRTWGTILKILRAADQDKRQ